MNKSKLVVFLLVCCMIVIISSCKKKEPKVQPSNTSAITLVIKAKYGTQSFALNSPNIDTAGRYLTMSALQFYLSHINLIKTDNTTVSFDSVAIVDFSDTTTLSITANIAPGSFTGISFGCGLDSIQNMNNANDTSWHFPNPYSYLWQMYWDMFSAYRFEVMEGKWAPTSTSNMPYPLIYHIGTNAASRQTKLNKSFSVCCNTPYTLTLYLDVQQIFSNSTTGEYINIVTEPETASGSADNPAIMTTFADNFSKAFTF